MTSTNVVIKCADLDTAVEYYAGQRGFLLHSIFPADDPQVITMLRDGLQLQLERVPHEPLAAGEWRVGRAGMRYRDLLADRCGGRIIASHIRIPGAGPVPDYVHYHDIELQLIYCHAGWVKVVYEDQGEPFVLRCGDAALQPPLIRHRVLESGDDLEVIEVTVPAEHRTFVDHELSLPTAATAPDRRWSDQRFVHHVAAAATWKPWRDTDWQARDLGIAAAAIHILRPTGNDTAGTRMHLALPDAEPVLLELPTAGNATS